MIWDLKLPGTPRANSACRGTPLLFYYYYYYYYYCYCYYYYYY